MWDIKRSDYEVSKDPKFLFGGNPEHLNLKIIDLSGKFSAFYGFGYESNHINAFAMGLYNKLRLKSNFSYKEKLIQLTNQGKTFCNVITNIQMNNNQFNNSDSFRFIVHEIFRDSFRNFDSMNFPRKYNNPDYNDFKNYNFYGQTFSLRILSKLFGVSSIIYKEIDENTRDIKLEIISPELQNYRPTLYFYALLSEGTYIIYLMTPKSDLLEEKQSKRIRNSKENEQIGEYIEYAPALLSCLSGINNLYNKIISNTFNPADDQQSLDKEVFQDLAVIRSSKRCNQLRLLLHAFTKSKKLNAKILNYERLDLQTICSKCFGPDGKDNKVFSLECFCLFHLNCLKNHIIGENKNTLDYNNVCLCGKKINQSLWLSIIENRDEYLRQYFKTKVCDKCGLDSSNSPNHTNNCTSSLCEYCMISLNKKTYYCSGCREAFFLNIDIEKCKYLCKFCNKLKSFFEIYFPDKRENVGCYECHLKSNVQPDSLLDLTKKLLINCINSDCVSRQMKKYSFYHPGKMTCLHHKELCFWCVISRQDSCLMCGERIELVPDLYNL